jgi:hypothetical protein
MSIIHDARALLALIQPMTGTRATGTATVRSTAATGTIEANVHAAPIVNGVVRPDLLVKTAVNPATSDGSWPVSQSGTSVPMLSVLGGAAHNLEQRTELRWVPQLDGITPTATIDPPGFTGAVSDTSEVGVAEARIFEDLAGTPAPGTDLFRSGLSRYPALMLCWQDSEPDDGLREQPLGRREARLGRNKTLLRNLWDMFVVVSRQDSDPARRLQGLDILDELTLNIVDRQAVDGMVFSTIRGLSIHARNRWVVSPTLYVYRLRFSTTNVAVKRERRTFGPWLVSKLDTHTTDSTPLPTVVDYRVNMPQE